jgi:rhamnosyl/mannosyltransferase
LRRRHTLTGFVVPPESSREFAAATRLLRDKVLAAQMGLAARACYERLFSAPALGKAYRELYDAVAGSGTDAI